jgi:hypothetical protein
MRAFEFSDSAPFNDLLSADTPAETVDDQAYPSRYGKQEGRQRHV